MQVSKHEVWRFLKSPTNSDMCLSPMWTMVAFGDRQGYRAAIEFKWNIAKLPLRNIEKWESSLLRTHL